MYHGTETIPTTYHYDRYTPSFGVTSSVKAIVPEVKHVYTCDACQARYAFTEQADEAFYCRCQALVAIT
jgi:hypothetical protein